MSTPGQGDGVSPTRRRTRRASQALRGGRRTDRVAEEIRQHILTRCHPDQRLASEREWAAQLGVSRKTVRNALANLADQGWVRRVPGQGFRVSRPRRQPSGATGLFFLAEPVYLLMEPFYRQVFLGISEVASRAGRGLVNFFGHAMRSPDVTPTTFWEPNLRAVDSLLILSLFNREMIAHAGQVHPVVCLDVDYDVPGVSFASFDHGLSLKLAVKYLMDLGHRRIGYVGRTVSIDPAVTGRVAGYHEAMRWAGLTGDEQWLLATKSPQSAEAVVARWSRMSAQTRPTALVVADNFWPVLAWATLMGIAVPEQLSLVAIGASQTWHDFVSFEQTESGLPERPASVHERILASRSLNLQLIAVGPTTVVLPAREMGQWGMAEVQRRLADPATAPARQRFIPQLAEGNTSGPPPRE